MSSSHTRPLDKKHRIDFDAETRTIEIVKIGNGVPIPRDEPIILFRGRDRLAVPMLRHYISLCVADGCNDWQLAQMNELLAEFQTFAETSPTMKQPGVTKGK